ncbi:hypothetical protein Q7P37_000977 [Cladosporium fusiforme]
MSTSAIRGKQMIETSNYAEAIKEFTSALKEYPTSPLFLTSRALAYQRSQQLPEALADADAAVVQAHKRAKKELIVDAQMRRGIILNIMGRYGDARAVFDIVKRMSKEKPELGMWAGRNDKKIVELGEDHESVRVTVKEVPDIQSGEHSQTSTTTNTTNAATPSAPAPVQQTPIEKIRHDWYQNNQNVYLTLLAKGVPQDKTQVDITERSMSISFPVAASGSTYDFTLDPLYAAVNPTSCITRVLPTKVEIILSKATPGQKWHALESSEPIASEPTTTGKSATDQPSTNATNPVAHTTLAAPPPSGPAYPTSSKSGPKNWDKFGDDDEEEEEGDSTNAFFKKLYKGASPEAQRAMMKSFTESNGTALSTNWDEVSKKKVETSPPDGMQVKDWEK